MKVQELRQKSSGQLNELLVDLKKEQFNLRFQAATGELKSPARIRQVRRQVAQILTVLSEQPKKKG